MKSDTVVTVDDLPSEVVAAIKDGRKVEAIKLLRIATGMGLANAKVLVDAAARRHGVQTIPPAMVEAGPNYASLVKIILLALLVAAAYQLLLS